MTPEQTKVVLDEAAKLRDGIRQRNMEPPWGDVASIVAGLLSAYEAQQQEIERLKKEVQLRREDGLNAHAQRLRSGDSADACERCGGWGVYTYPSTSTWMGGIGGCAMTLGVCDQCWGSGDKHCPWPSHREVAALRAKVTSLEAERDAAPLHQRGRDLLRQMRHELLDQKLISREEFADLCMGEGEAGEGSPAPRRLEAYDAHQARMGQAEADRDHYKAEAERMAARWEALKGDVGGAAVMAKLISPEGAAMADSVLGTMADLEAKR